MIARDAAYNVGGVAVTGYLADDEAYDGNRGLSLKHKARVCETFGCTDIPEGRRSYVVLSGSRRAVEASTPI
jgi:hypothetical protein